MGFPAGKGGFGRSRGGMSALGGRQGARLAIASGFIFMSVIAIGIPLIRVKTSEAPPPPPPSKVVSVQQISVLMPIERVSLGTPLQPPMFRKEAMSVALVSALPAPVIQSETEVTGKFAKTLLLPGRPLTADQVMDAPQNTVAKKIPPGYRAVTLKLDDVTGIEGWTLPNARVDVMWVTQVGSEHTVTTIVRNAEILSVMGQTQTASLNAQSGNDGTAGAAPKPPPTFTVTILVSPDDGQKIFLAAASGKLGMMLRGDFDATDRGGISSTISTNKLLKGDEPKELGVTERIDGIARVMQDDGTYKKWSLIEGKVWRPEDGNGPQGARIVSATPQL